MFASAINTVSYIPLRYRKIKLEKYASTTILLAAMATPAVLWVLCTDISIFCRANCMMCSYVLNQFEKHFSRYDLGVLKRSVDLECKDDMTKNDFILAMLLRLGKIKPSDMERIEEVFFKLDADKSGVLDRADLDEMVVKSAKTKNARELDVFDMESGDAMGFRNAGANGSTSEAAADDSDGAVDVDTIDNPLGAASEQNSGSAADT